MNFSRKFYVLLACSMAGTQIPTLKLLPLPLLWSWVSLEFLMTWMGISDHIEYILYWINWLWLQSHWIQCKRASKTGNFLPKVKMFIIWETLNFTWCFVHQTNSNCLNFLGIEWFYDWSRNKQVIHSTLLKNGGHKHFYFLIFPHHQQMLCTVSIVRTRSFCCK